jgi:ABC-2 type transport system ATP-binding protein
MSRVAIEFSGVSKTYKFGFLGKKQKALDSLDLAVPEGSIYGFLGANGAGKTTSIKILMGLQFADTGSVRVFGGDPGEAKTKARIGYLPERPYFHDTMTANELLDFHRNLFSGTLKGKKLPNNEELLALVGLAGVAGKQLKDFSKGMLQRAGIAQALVNNPDLVILDEPMSGLDPVGRREMRDLILKLAADGKTVFFSSHILSDVESICHRIAFLEKGVLKHEGDIRSMRSEGSRHEISFTGISEEKRKSSPALANAKPTGGALLLVCNNGEETQKSIEEIWRLGGKLLSYHPEQRSLEDFLFGEGKK